MRIHPARLAFALTLTIASPSLVRAQPLDEGSLPPSLRPWVPWVLANEPTYGCTRVGEALECAFPGALELALEGTSLRFSLAVTLDRKRLVALPGGEGEWPVEVREGNTPRAVLASADGTPMVELEAGSHRIEGRIRQGRAPESLKVPAEIARVFALSGGTRIPLERASEGVVALRALTSAAGAEASRAEADSLSLEVVRRVEDGAPLAIETRIVARISGRGRAIDLGRILVPGTVPSSVESTLPVQVSPEGDVVLQAQSGTHRIVVRALAASPTQALAAPSPGAPWPQQEIWVLAPNEVFRQVEVHGVSSIDPQSPTIPAEWRSNAAFVLRPGQSFTLTESRRGEAEPPPNALTLSRTLWLDFDGHGFTARDQLGGELPRARRLDLVDGDLGRVVVGGRDQLVTMPPGRARSNRGPRGFELRTTTLDARAELRIEAAPSDVPAVGWSEDPSSLSVTLNLPPGHSLFAARGVDDASDAWISRWDVGPLFLVLLIGVVMLRLHGRAAGLVAVLTLILVYHEPDAPRFVWLAVLVPAAILVLFKKGLFARIVFVGWALSAAALAVMIGLFVATQLRYAMHPQLYTEERFGSSYGTMDDMEGGGGMIAPAAPAAPSRSSSEEVAELIDGLARDSDAPRARRAGGSEAGPENWIDPNAVVQTGYGVVEWRHSAVELRWNGPVDKNHRIHLYVIRPWLQRLLALARVVGLLFLAAVVFRRRPAWPEKSDPNAEPPPAAPPTAPASTAVGVATLAFVLLVGAQATAQPLPPDAEPPTPSVLDELRTRLLEPPSCAPRCAQVGATTVTIEGDTMRIVMVAHAAVLSALPLPGPVSSFVPELVQVDGSSSDALRAGGDGHLRLRLSPGVHRVELVVNVRGRGSIALSFPDRPGHVSVTAPGFTLSGVDENGLVRGSLELRRQLTTTAVPAGSEGTQGAAGPRGADVPVWVAVERHLDVGVQWIVHTTIRRLSSTSAPAIVRLPALPGEAILGNDAFVQDGYVVATLVQGVPELSFTSRITVGSEVSFRFDPTDTAATDVHRTETWSYTCSPLWNCSFEGVVPYQHATLGESRPSFAPYPGESLKIRMQRLAAAPGASVTIDGASLTVTPGDRATNAQLSLRVRTSASNTLQITLPSDVEVERVTVNGERRPAQVRDRVLRLGIVPASRDVVIALRQRRGIGVTMTTPRISIGASAVNVDIRVAVPSNRWLLHASGPAWGPIILFWGYLLLVLVVAAILGRIAGSPLRTHEWALLGIGLLQLPLPFTLVVAAWFFATQAQHRRSLTGVWFNLAQVALSVHAFVAAGTLVSAVWIGLTERPDMQIVGYGSHMSELHWYQDRSGSTLPLATMTSVSIWVWKGLMLVWAFWLAWSVVRWAIWAVTPFREHGFFVRMHRAAQAPSGDQ